MGRMNQRVDAYCVVIEDDQLLMVRTLEGSRPTWKLPGGPVAFGEAPRIAASRALEEQTGFTATVAEQPYHVASRIMKPSGRSARNGGEELHTIGFYFRARTSSGTLTHATDGITDRAQWFALSELPRNRVRPVSKALDEAGVAWTERAPR